MKTLILIISSLILTFAISCKTQNVFEEKKSAQPLEESPSFSYNEYYEYKIRKNDKITLSVWGEDELSVGSTYGIYNSNEIYGKWLLVDANGEIEIPKIGTTSVVGKSIPELKEEIKDKLKKWLVNPIVDVKVLNKEIVVLGEVKAPSTITVDKDQNLLLDIISKSGGFDMYANLKSIKILRQEGNDVRVTNIDITKPEDFSYQNVQLHPGDYVIVPSKKYKEFDKRVSVIIPLTSTVSAAAILLKSF